MAQLEVIIRICGSAGIRRVAAHMCPRAEGAIYIAGRQMPVSKVPLSICRRAGDTIFKLPRSL